MDSLDFLELPKSGNATIVINVVDGTVTTIDNLDLDIISQKCPLLAYSFESRSNGKPKSWVDASSRTLIICFLRFLYVGDYSVLNGDTHEPDSLLIHAQLCQLGRTYEVPELQTMAHANMIRDTELSCSKPCPPDDLCEAIRFIYENLSDHMEMIDTILNYCASCFLYHRLATNDTFRDLAYELRSFHRDLCRTNYKRKFKDDGAPDIVRLPVKEAPQTLNEIMEIAALRDFPYDMWEEDDTKHLEPERQGNFAEELSSRLTYAVAYRPRPLLRPYENYRSRDSEGSGSETDGYTLVHRPKRDSTTLGRAQDEPNKRGRLSVSSSNALSEAVYETQRLAWLGGRTDQRSVEERVDPSIERLQQADKTPGGETFNPSEQPRDESRPAIQDVTHDATLDNSTLDHAVDEIALASDVEEDSVVAVTPGTESDFEHIYAVGELELQEDSDSEWSVL